MHFSVDAFFMKIFREIITWHPQLSARRRRLFVASNRIYKIQFCFCQATFSELGIFSACVDRFSFVSASQLLLLI